MTAQVLDFSARLAERSLPRDCGCPAHKLQTLLSSIHAFRVESEGQLLVDGPRQSQMLEEVVRVIADVLASTTTQRTNP